MMRVVWCADADAAGRAAAEIVARSVAGRPDSVLALPTGSSAQPMYDRLAALCAGGVVSFAGATAFHLDEYVGLPIGDPDAFSTYMRDRFARRVDLAAGRMRLLDGAAADPDEECRRYEDAIAAAGGLDLAVLGLGANGHIAFNEPGSTRTSRTRVVSLAAETRAANALVFGPGRRVPERAMTIGLATILDARSIVLIVAGQGKRRALVALTNGHVDPAWPATWLIEHRDVLVLADAALGQPECGGDGGDGQEGTAALSNGPGVRNQEATGAAARDDGGGGLRPG
jgi:glucosamine-6-phosphate deaminase